MVSGYVDASEMTRRELTQQIGPLLPSPVLTLSIFSFSLAAGILHASTLIGNAMVNSPLLCAGGGNEVSPLFPRAL